MKLVLPILLTIITATLVYWYADYVKKYQSIFLPAVFNGICCLSIATFAYFYEGSSCVVKLKESFLEPYIIPYLLLNVVSTCLWFYISKTQGAAYAGIFESTYIILLILMTTLIKGEAFDLKFFIGSLLVVLGIIVIEWGR